MTGAEHAARLRTVLSYPSFTSFESADVIMAPQKAGRVLGLVTTVDMSGAPGIEIHASSDDTAATVADDGTILPEATFSWVAPTIDVVPTRVGVWLPAHKSVLSDAGALMFAVQQALSQDVTRLLDQQIVAGSGVAPQMPGLLNSSLPTQAKGADSRFLALVKAISTIRGAEHVGTLSVVGTAATVTALLGDTTLPANYRSVLNEGVRSFVTSPYVTAGSLIVGDYASGAHLYVRSPLELAVTDRHNVTGAGAESFFLSGKVAIRIEGRYQFKAVRPSAFVVVTGV